MSSAVAQPPLTSAMLPSASNAVFQDKSKGREVRLSNVTAAKAISDAVRSSLGPKGMDKMIQTSKGELIITNDGATILKSIQALHPAAKMLVDLSVAQDVEAGDGTTTVVVLAGSILSAAENMLVKGLHPSIISDAFMQASAKAVEYLIQMSTTISLDDRASLVKAAVTSLNSKRPSLLRIANPSSSNVDLRDIRIVKRTGGTIEDIKLIRDGLVLNQNMINTAGGPNRVESASIGLIQFQLSAPKPDMDNTVAVYNYLQMDKIAKEQRKYILSLCSKIKKAGCNVLLIQKSILRDAVDDLALHILSKLKILVVKDIERDEIEFLSKTLRCKPVSDIKAFSDDKLGKADLVEEVSEYGSKYVKISGIRNMGPTVSIVAMGPNNLIVDEVERSLHDALCVMRCLVKKRALIAGGGAPEVHVSRMLSAYGRSLKGAQAYCFQAYADALEVIPITLAENAGLNAISVLTELRNRHALGERTAGIDMRKGLVSDVVTENVVQPLLVSTSAFELATETVCLLLKIDDYVQAR